MHGISFRSGGLETAPPILREQGVRANDSRAPNRATFGPPQATYLARPLLASHSDAECSLELRRPVEAELYDPCRDQAGALAARVAGDVELGGERVEAALGGALADVQRLGELGAGGWAAGEGALAAVGGDQRRGRRPLLLVESDRRFARRHRGAGPARHGIGDFKPVIGDGEDVA